MTEAMQQKNCQRNKFDTLNATDMNEIARFRFFSCSKLFYADSQKKHMKGGKSNSSDTLYFKECKGKLQYFEELYVTPFINESVSCDASNLSIVIHAKPIAAFTGTYWKGME